MCAFRKIAKSKKELQKKMTIHILSVSCTTATGLSQSVTIIKTNITSTYFNGMVDVRTGVLITFKTERKLNFFQSKIFNCFQHTFAHSKVKDLYIHRNVMIFRASTTYISIYTYFNLTINSSLYPVDQKYMNPEYISYVVFLKKKKRITAFLQNCQNKLRITSQIALHLLWHFVLNRL